MIIINNLIWDYLTNDIDLITLLGNKYIWLIEKPKSEYIIKEFGKDADNYIIYKYKELNGGFIKDYQVEFNILGKDLVKLLAIKEQLISLLDDPREEKIIKNKDITVRQSKLLNGGGMVKNPETSNYEVIVFFLLKN